MFRRRLKLPQVALREMCSLFVMILAEKGQKKLTAFTRGIKPGVSSTMLFCIMTKDGSEATEEKVLCTGVRELL